jgi:hypothetical protein
MRSKRSFLKSRTSMRAAAAEVMDQVYGESEQPELIQ